MRIERVVFDTSVLIESFLSSTGPSASIIEKVFVLGIELLFSVETYDELQRVIERPKFDRYVSLGTRRALVDALIPSQFVQIQNRVMGCRDPADDKFLETAVEGFAHALIARDNDLLTMVDIQGIPIYTPQHALLSLDE